ncbi:MAG: CRISPR-associated endonuclease Cas2 [Gammaproteobacteria bacterium]|nr:CRISPR-associated endonuclease Cas2 [Gammaproteobacteria bacterium]
MRRIQLSPYRIMWLFVMFDLPVGTEKERKQATAFRNHLLDLGFEMSQFSVYLKFCISGEKAESVGNQIQRELPPGGKVDILTITDKQFMNMRRFYAKTQIKNDGKLPQLRLF